MDAEREKGTDHPNDTTISTLDGPINTDGNSGFKDTETINAVSDSNKEDIQKSSEDKEDADQDNSELSLSLMDVSKNEENPAADAPASNAETSPLQNDSAIAVDETEMHGIVEIETAQQTGTENVNTASPGITIISDVVEEHIHHHMLGTICRRSCYHRFLVFVLVLVLGGIIAFTLRYAAYAPEESAIHEPPRQLINATCKNPTLEKTPMGFNMNYVVRIKLRPRDMDANEISDIYLEIFDQTGSLLGSTDLISGHQLVLGGLRVTEFFTEIRLSPTSVQADTHTLLAKWTWQKGIWGDPRGWHSASEAVDILVSCPVSDYKEH